MPARDDIDRISQAQSRLVARSDRAASADAGAIWMPFLALTTTPAWPKDKTRGAVLSNLVALVLFGSAIMAGMRARNGVPATVADDQAATPVASA